MSNLVQDKMKKYGDRIDRLTRIYREVLLFTNQSYFLEEISKLRKEKQDTQTKYLLLDQKLQLMID